MFDNTAPTGGRVFGADVAACTQNLLRGAVTGGTGGKREHRRLLACSARRAPPTRVPTRGSSAPPATSPPQCGSATDRQHRGRRVRWRLRGSDLPGVHGAGNRGSARPRASPPEPVVQCTRPTGQPGRRAERRPRLRPGHSRRTRPADRAAAAHQPTGRDTGAHSRSRGPRELSEQLPRLTARAPGPGRRARPAPAPPRHVAGTSSGRALGGAGREPGRAHGACRRRRDELARQETRLDDEARVARKRRRRSVDTKMYSGEVSSPRELQAMQADVEQLQRHQRDVENRELEIMSSASRSMPSSASSLPSSRRSPGSWPQRARPSPRPRTRSARRSRSSAPR